MRGLKLRTMRQIAALDRVELAGEIEYLSRLLEEVTQQLELLQVEEELREVGPLGKY